MPSGLVGLDIMTMEVRQLHLDAVGVDAPLEPPILAHLDVALQLRRPLVQPDDARYEEVRAARDRWVAVCEGLSATRAYTLCRLRQTARTCQCA